MDESKPQRRFSSLALRWLTALILIPIVLLFVWFGGWVAFLATATIVVVGSLELNHMFTHAGHRPQLWVMIVLGVLFLLAPMFPQQQNMLLQFGLSGILIGSFTTVFFRRRIEGSVVDWALSIAIGFYLGWTNSHFLWLRGHAPSLLQPFTDQWISLPEGAWWVLATLVGVWSFDAAAFFVGRHFGRHKLAPTISPAKTWEGALGGFFFCVIACLILTVWPLHLPWYLALFLALLISAAATLGDLAESLLKRQTNVKDSGQIVPGHGGLLDRVDSSLFAIVVVFIFVQCLQWFPF